MEIELAQGKVVIIDDSDYELVCLYKWHNVPCDKDVTIDIPNLRKGAS